MRIETLGKRKFAFGLTWVPADDGRPVDIVRETSTLTKAVYASVTNDESKTVVGYAPDEPTAKGKVYSYAAALASLGQDGVYVGPVDDKLWYVAISKGLVVPATDQILEMDAALSAIENIRSMGLPVIVMEGAPLPLHAERVFDPERAVASIKAGQLRRMGADKADLIKGGIVVAGLVGLGVFGYTTFIKKPDNSAELDAQTAAQIRATYITTMQTAAAAIPADPAWVVRAYESSSQMLPAMLAGWRLEGATCTPASCVANYSLAQGTGYAVSPFYERFGGAVQVLGDQRSLSVTLPLHQVAMINWPEATVFAPPAPIGRALDAAGRVALRFSNVTQDGPVKTLMVSGNVQPPPLAPAVVTDTIAVRQGEALDGIRLRGITSYFSDFGFAATTLAYSNGDGAAPRAWRIEFTRIHGGEG